MHSMQGDVMGELVPNWYIVIHYLLLILMALHWLMRTHGNPLRSPGGGQTELTVAKYQTVVVATALASTSGY